MNAEQEKERYLEIIKQIEEATSIDKLPRIQTIKDALASNSGYKGSRLSNKEFDSIIYFITKHGFKSKIVERKYKEIYFKNYPGITEEEIKAKYDALIDNHKIDYIIAKHQIYHLGNKNNLKQYPQNSSPFANPKGQTARHEKIKLVVAKGQK